MIRKAGRFLACIVVPLVSFLGTCFAPSPVSLEAASPSPNEFWVVRYGGWDYPYDNPDGCGSCGCFHYEKGFYCVGFYRDPNGKAIPTDGTSTKDFIWGSKGGAEVHIGGGQFLVAETLDLYEDSFRGKLTTDTVAEGNYCYRGRTSCYDGSHPYTEEMWERRGSWIAHKVEMKFISVQSSPGGKYRGKLILHGPIIASASGGSEIIGMVESWQARSGNNDMSADWSLENATIPRGTWNPVEVWGTMEHHYDDNGDGEDDTTYYSPKLSLDREDYSGPRNDFAIHGGNWSISWGCIKLHDANRGGPGDIQEFQAMHESLSDAMKQALRLRVEYRPWTPLLLRAVCHSPVDLVVTDPDGFVVSKDASAIDGAVYDEEDVDGDGELEGSVTVYERKSGYYKITAVPHSDASPTENYSIEVEADEQTLVLAEDVAIGEIPERPYVLDATEAGVTYLGTPALPTADAGDWYDGSEGSPVLFDGSASSDPEEQPLGYRWDFNGDGVWDTDWSSEATASHTWLGAHTGVVYLQVTDGQYVDTDSAGVDVFSTRSPQLLCCDSEGNPSEQFAAGETVYVKGSELLPNTTYTVWIQDDPIEEGDGLVAGEDPSGYQESVTTDHNGNFAPLAIWTSDAAVGYRNYGVVLDCQNDLGNPGTYDSVSDGIESMAVRGAVTCPVAENQTVITDEDTAVAITLTATDAEGDPLTYYVVDGPAHGSLSGIAPNLTYIPEMNYDGADAFTFRASDSTSESNLAMVSIIVVPVDYPAGDINRDRMVNYKDLAILGAHYGEKTAPPYPAWDINQDGIVNYKDLAILGAHYGETY